MNEVYNDVLGKALSIKSTNNIVVKVDRVSSSMFQY